MIRVAAEKQELNLRPSPIIYRGRSNRSNIVLRHHPIQHTKNERQANRDLAGFEPAAFRHRGIFYQMNYEVTLFYGIIQKSMKGQQLKNDLL